MRHSENVWVGPMTARGRKYHQNVKRRSMFLIALVLAAAVAIALLLDHFAFAPRKSYPPPNAVITRSCLETKALRSGGTSFRYPSCWTLSNYTEGSMFTTVVAFLTTQPLHNPCKTTRSGISTIVSCGFPLKKLKHGGLLVTFIEGGMPGWTIADETGRHLVIDHHAARETLIKKPHGSLGATVEYWIMIGRSVPDNYYEFEVFFRNPGVSKDQKLLQQMLSSMRID
jgi:hypothetical protein